MSSRTNRLMHNVRKMPLVQQLIPMEAAVGWPAPITKNGEVYLILPFYGASPTSRKGQLSLYPPIATVTLNWRTGIVVEYLDLRFRPPFEGAQWTDPVGKFPHESVADLRISDYLERREELLTRYDELLDILSKNGTFSARWTSEFAELLRLMLEPSLEPYYRALAPRFFERFLGPDNHPAGRDERLADGPGLGH